MKAIMVAISFAILSSSVFCDDAAFCQKECARNYNADHILKDACLVGCQHRGSVSDGNRGFVLCHNGCATVFNETATEEKNAAEGDASTPASASSRERDACNWACSRPMTSMVMMKVDYGSGDESPKVEVIRKEGGDVFQSDSDDSVDNFGTWLHSSNGLFGSRKDKSGEEITKNEPSMPAAQLTRKAQSDDSIPDGLISSMFSVKTGDPEMDKMNDHFSDLLRGFFQRARMSSNAAIERPNGHDELFLSRVPMVGNEDEAGRQILFVSPMEGEHWMDWRDQEARRAESTWHYRFPAIFQWMMCAVLLLAILCVLMFSTLIVRRMRAHRYRQLRCANGAPTSSVQPTLGAAAPELVKKVPIDMEEGSLSEPSGVPPPAYDQLSVHSKHALP